MVRRARRALRFVALAGAVALTPAAQPRGAGSTSEWAAYAADNGGSKYSPLEQVNKDTVKNLRIAWRQSAVPGDLGALGARVRPANFENTPVMIGGLLYVGTALGTVAALDPATGKVVWLEELPPDATLTPTSALGTGARGVAHWSGGGSGRILSVRGRWLVALDAKTGKRIAQFGEGGQVDLATGYDRAARNYSWRSIPVVVRDVIVVGGLSGAGPASGDVRGYDVRTGKQLWTFHVIPRPGEFGNDSWQKDSWEQGTAAGVWGLMSADEELGYVYLPTESSASRGGGDYYGAHRPGNGLFAESLVCLDARTGKRVSFQMVHHGLWDFDLGAAPNLVDITVDGRRIKAVAQVSKQNFIYVFDRITGKPVWPIEERPVPKGDMPDEWYSPTQPVPTRPPAYDQQGATIDDLIDFTPELRQDAIKILSRYRYGSLFEPPSMADPGPGGKQGTARIPGTVANVWNGAGVDPETGILYVPSVHCPVVIEMIKPTVPNSPTEFINKQGPPPPGAAFLEGPIVGPWLVGPQGLPLFKPPYGRLVAIDLNKGEILWTVANGDGPRDHPAINALNLPPLGQPGRAAPMITKTLVFLGEGGNGGGILALPPWGGGKKFKAYDKGTGEVVWEMALPGGTIGAPMTYMVDGTQYIVVAVGWKEMAPELIALALPKT